MNDLIELPAWDGSRCQHCDGSKYHRVLSVEEIQRVFPVKDSFWWWPLPNEATHMCVKCGFAYSGLRDDALNYPRPEPDPYHNLDVSDWDWDPVSQFDGTMREAVIQFIRAAPDDVETARIAEGVDQHIAGGDAEFAREVMASLDDYDRPALPVDRFM